MSIPGPKSSIIKLTKLKFDTEEKVIVGPESEWVKPLMDELNEQVDADDLASTQSPVGITFNGTIIKKKNVQFEEMVVLRGDLRADFLTCCVSTGQVMHDSVETEVNAAMVEISYEAEDEHGEVPTDTLVDGVEHELYFYKDNEIDLLPIFHEFIYLNKNPYPRVPEAQSKV